MIFSAVIKVIETDGSKIRNLGLTKKNPKHQFLPPFIIAFISQVKAFKLLIFWHQDLWGISAK